MRRHRGLLVTVALIVVPFGFFFATSGWPLIALVDRAVTTGEGAALGDAFGGTRIARLAFATLAQAALSTLIALIIGIPCAYCHARFRVPGQRLAWVLVAVPFVLPTVVVAAAVGRAQRLMGLDGVSAWVPVITSHVVVNLAVIVRTVGVRLERIDVSVEDAARLGGRSATGAAWCVIRSASDAIRSAAIIVFLFCATSFGIIAVLGGGSVSTVEIEIWFQATQLLRLDVAALLSCAQMLVVAVVVLLTLRGRRPNAVLSGASPRRRPRGLERWLVGVLVGVQLLVALGPVALLVERSLRVGDHWGIDHYRNLGRALAGTGLGERPWRAAGESLRIAVVAAAIALVVGLLAAVGVASGRRGARIVEAALLIPLAASAATIGFGILIAYSRPPLDLRGSWWAVPVVESAIAAPLVARSLVPVFASLDRRQLDAAALLGAGPRRRFLEIVVPSVRAAVGVAAGLGFAVSLGEFGATAFLARSGSPTLPQLMVRLLGRPGDANLGQGMAIGVVMAALTAGVFAAAEAIGRGRSLEF